MIIQSEQTAGGYLCLLVGDCEYGIRTTTVKSVYDAVTIRKVPKSPSFVKGVANIMGRIVPVVDVSRRFGIDTAPGCMEARIVLVQHGMSVYGLAADTVNSIVEVTEDAIEPINPLLTTREAPFISGMAKIADRIIHLIDLPLFLFAGVDLVEERQAAYAAYVERTTRKAVSGAKDLTSFLRVEIGEEKYGLGMKGVLGVVPVEMVQVVADGPPYLAGTIATEHGKLAVIDLQKKYGLDPLPYGAESLVVVVQSRSYCFGILVNSVRDIARVDRSQMKDSPVILGRDEKSHVRGIVLPQQGSGLFMIIDEDNILEKNEKSELHNMEITSLQKEKATGGSKEKKQPFVIFRVAGTEFALRAELLLKVIEYSPAKKVPKAPDYVRGILAVDGELVSIIDLRKRFDLKTSEEKGDEWIIMVRLPGRSLQGILADEVTEIRQIVAEEIVPTPDLSGPVDTVFTDGIILIGDQHNRSPFILDIARVLEIDKA
jgi:purine-binding chemotaxis protein CheW